MASWTKQTQRDTNTYETNCTVASTAHAFTKLSPKIRCRHSHCNVSDKGFWTRGSRWIMQFTLARPTPHILNTIEVSRYGNWTVCSWVGESGGKNNPCNANDKPPSLVHHPPAGSVPRFTRGRVQELKNAHNSVTIKNRTHAYMNVFDHKDLGNHLLQ